MIGCVAFPSLFSAALHYAAAVVVEGGCVVDGGDPTQAASQTPLLFCLQTVGYGHLGDGNLHLNVAAPTDDDAVQVDCSLRWNLRLTNSLPLCCCTVGVITGEGPRNRGHSA